MLIVVVESGTFYNVVLNVMLSVTFYIIVLIVVVESGTFYIVVLNVVMLSVTFLLFC